ncbi:MAG: redoxin domain-containing protein [Labilithrix sp.]|nr:redoxin domain-containing protein [Labilithrix sp.]MBX3221440.1 redoxin domain-containing protein [Labilithrix sp.]
MRTRTALSLMATALVVLSACGEDPPAKDPSSVNTKESDSKSGDKDGDKDGDKGGGKSEISCKGKPEVGKNASSFSLTSVNGGNKIGVEKGKVTIVDFWATWCEPCKKSFPKYQELYVKYKTSGLEILAISVDDEKKEIPDFIKTYGAKFPVGWDEGHKIADCYKPPNMPSAYVIDKQGVIKFVHNGYHDGEEKELEKEIKSLL